MLDYHTIPSADWGIRPVLFKVDSFPVDSYSFFVTLGLIVGLIVYYYLAKEEKKLSEKSF